MTNKWFTLFLKDWKQYTTIQGIKSDQNSIDYGVSQGSLLASLLLIIFINDLHSAVQFSAAHHSADDMNFLLSDYILLKKSQQTY